MRPSYIPEGTRFLLRARRDATHTDIVTYRFWAASPSPIQGSAEGRTVGGVIPASAVRKWRWIYAILAHAKKVTDTDTAAILAVHEGVLCADDVLRALVAKGIVTLADVKAATQDALAVAVKELVAEEQENVRVEGGE